MRKRVAILNAVSSTAMPLLGATLIAVLTFLPVYLSPHITGEILSSLFIVIAVSLLLSWVLAITQNVFFVQEFVRRPRPEELKNELFTGRIYDFFRKALSFTIRKRYTVVRMHGCTAGCGRMGIQIYSSAIYATIKQAILFRRHVVARRYTYRRK